MNVKVSFVHVRGLFGTYWDIYTIILLGKERNRWNFNEKKPRIPFINGDIF